MQIDGAAELFDFPFEDYPIEARRLFGGNRDQFIFQLVLRRVGSQVSLPFCLGIDEAHNRAGAFQECQWKANGARVSVRYRHLNVEMIFAGKYTIALAAAGDRNSQWSLLTIEQRMT